ncbi:DUF6266 family protein [Flavobacterium sp. I3-2]|uniref:DUF6266 family protein n=1 Tax=Flavobacterium sp. I3-2 TaxID=2748319 RepID=UPI0015AFE7A7|nr:DUF6266 family protein [Flavobacterium sp. I3-2]
MGKITDSIISGSTGRIGRVVVANVNGQEILRMRPQKSTKPPTAKQNLIKDRFLKSILFVQSYKEFAKMHFGTKIGMKSCYNQATASVLKALVCDMDTLTITPNYAEIQFAKGNGLIPSPIGLASSSALTIEISWDNNAQGTPAENDTLVVLLAEDQALNNNTLFFTTNIDRSQENYELTLLSRYQGIQMHVWIAFINQEQTKTSNSVYLGTVTVT